MSGIELMALRMARRIREANEEQERLNNLSNQQVTTTNNTNRITLPTQPEPEEPTTSAYALWAFNLIFFAAGTFIVGVVALFLGLPISVAICFGLSGFGLLTSISLAVLSLRENL